MERLFAPWRMKFIEDPSKDEGCILCTLSKSKKGQDSLVIESNKLIYVVLNKFPYANGHLMIVPHRHVGEWTDLNEEEMLAIGKASQVAIRALQRSLSPQGMNMGVNLGRPAGAGIVGHVHLHVVPRWVGDVNFMPLFSEVKVISEHLHATYDKIVGGWGS